MSAQAMADDLQLVEGCGDARHSGGEAASQDGAAVRQQIATRDLLAAVQQLRREAEGNAASASGGVSLTKESDVARSRAAWCHAALEGESPVPAPSVVQAAGAGDPVESRRGRPTPLEPWLPERDGPVSLAGVSAPRTPNRASRRSTATPDKAHRRPSRQGREGRGARAPRTRPLEAALVAAATAAPPRVIVLGACGGAGATTLTVLLGAALAPTPAPGALLIVAGADRGALAARSDTTGGDLSALGDWVRAHPGAGLQPTTPGLATGHAGTGSMILAAPGRELAAAELDGPTAEAVLAAACVSRAAVLVDWRCRLATLQHVWPNATHVLVAAPRSTVGLLQAESTVQCLEQSLPPGPALSVAVVDVSRDHTRRSRGPMSRLRALNLPVTTMPHDAALANDPRVNWLALRPRTRAAVVAALTQLLPSDPPFVSHRGKEDHR